MAELNNILAANEEYSKGFKYGDLPIPPSRRSAVLAPFPIDSKHFAIILSTLYLLISNSVHTYSYGIEYPQNTQAYVFEYTANKSEAICNGT